MTGRKRFSKGFETFQEWKSQARSGTYKNRIMRLHALYPKASLSQLRGHPTRREKSLGKMNTSSKAKVPYHLLKPKERYQRDRALDVLSLMRRKGKSMTSASREVGISPETVIKYTRGVKKVKNRWVLKQHDVVPRIMRINSNEQSYSVQIRDSRHASLLGMYHSAVGKSLETGDASHLKQFQGRAVKDLDGHWHRLETNLQTLYEIMERRPDEEFFTIYDSAGGEYQ